MKRFTALFLIFSLLMLSVNLYAKERRGAKIKIYKTKPIMDGTPWEIPPDISGELIAVKQNSLLLLDAEGKDVSVDIAEIKAITVMKKSKVLFGAGIGLLGGAVLGAFMAEWGRSTVSIMYAPFKALGFEEEEHATPAQGAMIGGCIGALIGGIFGALPGKDKIIQLEGMTDSEIQETLDYLRKRARVRDYK